MVYRITIRLLSFLTRRLKAAALAEYKAHDKLMDAAQTLRMKALDAKVDAARADTLAAKIDELVK